MLIGFDERNRLHVANTAFCIGHVLVQGGKATTRRGDQSLQLGDLACSVAAKLALGLGSEFTRPSALSMAHSQRGSRGSRIVNTVPVSAADRTVTVPSCPRTISCTMNRPSPRLVFERSSG
jgi:hypothetical protein